MIVHRYYSVQRILANNWKPLAYFTALSAFVAIVHQPGDRYLELPTMPINVLGIALAIFLAFRCHKSYERWWEARILWGGLVNYSRTFARQVTTLITSAPRDPSKDEAALQDLHRELVYRHVAYVNALRMSLRKQEDWEDLSPFLDSMELRRLIPMANKPTQLVQKQAERMADCFRRELVTDYQYMQIDSTLNQLYNIQGACERIKNTVFPRYYHHYTRLIVWVYVTLIPFGMAENLELLDVPLAVLMCFVFYILHKLGDRTEDPFDNRVTDTPMSALSRTIEIDLRQQLGETETPPPLKPVDGVLM
jgi:putative membrane protein